MLAGFDSGTGPYVRIRPEAGCIIIAWIGVIRNTEDWLIYETCDLVMEWLKLARLVLRPCSPLDVSWNVSIWQ